MGPIVRARRSVVEGRASGRDRGVTLVELLVTVLIMGLVTAAAAAAVLVILRSEDGVVASTAESHDTRQFVSYFPLDVGSGPFDPSAYRAAVIGGTATSDARGSGCDEVGNDNVLRIDLDDDFDLDLVDKRIAYRQVVAGDRAGIDRYVCTWTGTAWQVESILNVADFIDPSATVVAEAEVNVAATGPSGELRVSSVEFRYGQRGTVETISAAPNEEEPFANSGLCGSDPLSAARNFSSFFEGDVLLAGPSGTAVKSSLFVGGTLTFKNGGSAAQAVPDQPDLPIPGRVVGLLTTAVDWGNSTGTFEVKAAPAGVGGHDVLIQDDYFWNTGPGSTTITEDASATGAEIKLSSGAQAITPPTEPYISPGAAFAELRSCSDRLAGLPDTCDNGNCAAFVGPPSGYTDLASAGPQLRLDLSDDDEVANVFNIHADDLALIDEIQIGFAPGESPDVDNPFIINVANDDEDRDIVFESPTLQGSGVNSETLIWNFPNAENVTIQGSNQIWGTIMAPYAKVTSYVDIDGSVIARSLDMYGSEIFDERSFQGELFWD